MAQPTAAESNGILTPGSEPGHHLATPSKRKRDDDDGANAADGDTAQQDDAATRTSAARKQRKLISAYFDVLASLDAGPAIMKRPLADSSVGDEQPEAKRKKPKDARPTFSIRDKVAGAAYAQIEDIARDALQAADAALVELSGGTSDRRDETIVAETNRQIRAFREKALDLVQGEIAYPQVPVGRFVGSTDAQDAVRGQAVLTVTGYAPQERRLFSSLPRSRDIDLSNAELPPGVSITHIVPLKPNKKARSLGDTFAPPRPLPPLPPPKQPKTATKGNVLDLYHPELVDTNKYRANCYYTTRLAAGHFLDYSKATPPSQTKSRLHERVQSLSAAQPSAQEREMMEMETLFRGAFSSFAPCKDDTSAVVPSNTAGRVWWQQLGQRNFQRRIEAEYYAAAGSDADPLAHKQLAATPVLDEEAVQEAIDGWDESAVDPTLASVMGAKEGGRELEVDEVLDEVSDLIETLASYQRIRNLSLPNSQNRNSVEPVKGDMLATDLPRPSEEERAMYEVLKAQLALIIQTLPPYAVAKLNGDQLEDLLISTKIQVQTEEYQGTMEEDDTAVQARLRAQQQAQQQSAQGAGARTTAGQQRPANAGPTSYGAGGPGQYQAGNQHGTPSRPPPPPGQHYRPGLTPNQAPPPSRPMQQQQQQQQQQHLARPPQQATQYSNRQNGHPSQYATQLAKAQTPYGHQNVPQYANQQRPPAQPAHLHAGAGANARYGTPQGYAQPATAPGPSTYGSYANGPTAPARTASPSVLPQRPSYSPSPAAQQQAGGPRYATPGAASSAVGRYASNASQQNPGLTGYHTVISEAQQQRILDQAKARVAAQERSTMFADRLSSPGASSYGAQLDAQQQQRLAAARAGVGGKSPTPVGSARAGANGTGGAPFVPPHKVTPVPVPVIPGAASSSSQQSSQRRSESAS